MIRTNLSTRPFYNERAVNAWLLIVAVLVAFATIFNVTRVLQYSRSDTELANQANQDESRARELRQQAARLRATVDPRQIEYASNEARQANELIDRRTFSWTELFNRFETTLPDDVRITSVRPHIERETGIQLAITVMARDVTDINAFMERMQATGAFRNVRPVEDHADESGQLQSLIEANYVPAPASPARPADAKPRRR